MYMYIYIPGVMMGARISTKTKTCVYQTMISNLDADTYSVSTLGKSTEPKDRTNKQTESLHNVATVLSMVQHFINISLITDYNISCDKIKTLELELR